MRLRLSRATRMRARFVQHNGWTYGVSTSSIFPRMIGLDEYEVDGASLDSVKPPCRSFYPHALVGSARRMRGTA